MTNSNVKFAIVAAILAAVGGSIIYKNLQPTFPPVYYNMTDKSELDYKTMHGSCNPHWDTDGKMAC